MSVGLVVTALPLDRADEHIVYTPTDTTHITRLSVLLYVCMCVSTLGRLLPDAKFVPTAHERLSACPRARNNPAALAWTWNNERPMTMAWPL